MLARFKSLLVLVLISGSVLARFDATIPVIDLKDYYSQDKHAIFIQELANAMQTVGFVAVVNSSVDKTILDNAYNAARDFYSSPMELKMQGHNPSLNGQRGYVRSETAKGQNTKDFKEFYHIARDYSPDVLNKYGYKPNVWPNDTNFKNSMQSLIREMDAYVMVICEALAESIGQPQTFFTDMTTQGAFLLRSLHYPANPPANTIWAAAHTDIDLFTILPRATAEGLQVLNAEGQWVDVLVPDDAFIINAGDMLQNITNGVYKSAMHRVVCQDASKERYSMVAFVHPRPQDALDPLPAYVKKVGEQKFAAVTGNELLFERLIDLGLHSPALLQEFAASGAIDRLIDVNRASLAAMQTLRDANLASPKVLAALQMQEEKQ